MCFPHSASSSCHSSSQRVARQVWMPLHALLTVWFESHHSYCQFITGRIWTGVSCDWVTHPNSQFQFSWSVLGASSYTFQPGKWSTLYTNIFANVIYSWQGYSLFARHRIFRGFLPSWSAVLMHRHGSRTRVEYEFSKWFQVSCFPFAYDQLVKCNFERVKELSVNLAWRDNRIRRLNREEKPPLIIPASEP